MHRQIDVPLGQKEPASRLPTTTVLATQVEYILMNHLGDSGSSLKRRRPLTRIPQTEDELAIAAYLREVLAANVALTLQLGVVDAQLRRIRIVTHDELARTAWDYLFLLEVVLNVYGSNGGKVKFF